MRKEILSCCVLLAGALLGTTAQTLTERYGRFLTQPEGYVCLRTADSICIDGIADEAVWRQAPAITAFTDISGEGHPAPRFHTEARMLWDDRFLYIAACLKEPDVWADLTLRDTIVYYNNDFEVFIDPDGDGHNYFEIEVNALGTVFDLFLEKPYRAPQRPHVQFQWNCPGLRIATHIDGTINRPGDADRGWSVEMAIPREAIAAEFDNCLQAGRYLRIGFSRVQWQHHTDKDGRYRRKQDAGGRYLPEDNWTWGPTGQVAMHMPERWGYVYLSDRQAGSGAPEAFHHPVSYPVERFLWMLFYAQEEQYAAHGRYHASLEAFGLTREELNALPAGSLVSVEAISRKYEITVSLPCGTKASIDEEGKLTLKQ